LDLDAVDGGESGKSRAPIALGTVRPNKLNLAPDLHSAKKTPVDLAGVKHPV